MTWEKTKRDLVEQAIVRDAFCDTVTVKVPNDAKYWDPFKRKEHAKKYPDLSVGKRVVLRVYKDRKNRTIAGYLLGVLLDYNESRGLWRSDTDMILQVVSATTEDLLKWKGRLVTACLGGRYFFSGSFQVNGFNYKDYHWLDG